MNMTYFLHRLTNTQFESYLLPYVVLLYLCLYTVAVGEPPHCLSCSALFAVKRAIESARNDGGNVDFFPLGEVIHNSSES